MEVYKSSRDSFRKLTGVGAKFSRFVDEGVKDSEGFARGAIPRRNHLGRKGSNFTVLIVDDDSTFRKALHALFDSGSGFNACVEAQSGVEAIAKTKQLLPNLAILAFSMPEMSGLQLARNLKAIAPALPIFMLTAEYDSVIEKEALSCGITAVFSKLDDLAPLVANARAVCGIE